VICAHVGVICAWDRTARR
jgi:uncharacterized zinc-type alcohol dehydrogenase-like protein